MSWENLHVDDYGQVGKLTCQQDGSAEDISSYTTLQFIFTNPDDTELSPVTAAFDSDGTDGILKYTIAEDLLDTVGDWTVQARVSKTGARLTSDKLSFYVAP